MTRAYSSPGRALAVCFFLANAPTGALAQSTAEPPIHYMRGIGLLTGAIGSCTMMGGMSSFADERILFLEKELRITSAQQPIWAAYAAALKAHLERMAGMQQSVMKILDAKNPVDRIRSYVAAMDIRLSSLKALEPALAELYGALDADQKERSDAILTGMGCTM